MCAVSGKSALHRYRHILQKGLAYVESVPDNTVLTMRGAFIIESSRAPTASPHVPLRFQTSTRRWRLSLSTSARHSAMPCPLTRAALWIARCNIRRLLRTHVHNNKRFVVGVVDTEYAVVLKIHQYGIVHAHGNVAVQHEFGMCRTRCHGFIPQSKKYRPHRQRHSDATIAVGGANSMSISIRISINIRHACMSTVFPARLWKERKAIRSKTLGEPNDHICAPMPFDHATDDAEASTAENVEGAQFQHVGPHTYSIVVLRGDSKANKFMLQNLQCSVHRAVHTICQLHAGEEINHAKCVYQSYVVSRKRSKQEVKFPWGQPHESG